MAIACGCQDLLKAPKGLKSGHRRVGDDKRVTPKLLEMLGQSRDVEVADRMFLVRMHEDRPAFQLVACKDWRGVARSLLNEEYARLTREQEVHV